LGSLQCVRERERERDPKCPTKITKTPSPIKDPNNRNWKNCPSNKNKKLQVPINQNINI